MLPLGAVVLLAATPWIGSWALLVLALLCWKAAGRYA